MSDLLKWFQQASGPPVIDQDNRHNRVIVVDDEPVISSTLQKIFQRAGYDTRAFTNPFNALEAVHEFRPHVLVTDVMMPQLSGIDLAAAINQLVPSCKVLLVSGHANTIDLLTAAEAAGHDFLLLAKPVRPPELLQIVHQLLVVSDA